MTSTSLDKIVKSMLLKRRYPLAYYIDFLVYGASCLRELSFDLPIMPIRYAVLPVDPTNGNTIDLPNDYQDWTGVFVRRDQYLIPLIEDKALNLVPNYDSTFTIQPYSQGVATDTAAQSQINQYVGGLSAYWWMVNWDNFGENLGRQFGGMGTYLDTFREDRAKNQIKINENLLEPNILLGYISDGQDADSATQINSYCQATFEAYILWQHYLNNRTYSQNEADDMEDKYNNEVVKLRARLSDITIDKLKRVAQGNSIAIKY